MSVATNTNYLLEIEHLVKHFPIKGKLFAKPAVVKAVNNVSFGIPVGDTFGLVGESGCGKTTLIRTIMRLIEPTSGNIYFQGQDFSNLSPRDVKDKRRNMQIVFQDPYASLHPKMRIKQILEEPLIINHIGSKKERELKISRIIHKVGLEEEHLNRYAFEFSGGQRQRIVIARALILEPKLLILDEPVSALDVSIRSQILNLLEELQQEMNLTYLFISHDLSVVEHICDWIMVMYLGKVMEIGSRDQIFSNPMHPYTQALLSAIPSIDSKKSNQRIVLEGDLPSPVNPPAGCIFKTRCRYRSEKCDKEPAVYSKDGHQVVCHLYD